MAAYKNIFENSIHIHKKLPFANIFYKYIA